MGNEDWTRGYALQILKDAIEGLDGEYDDENQAFLDVRHGDESLVVKVTDATDESLVEEFIINFD